MGLLSRISFATRAKLDALLNRAPDSSAELGEGDRTAEPAD